MICIGVDPGLSGGIAVLDECGCLLRLFVMPLMPGTPKRIDWPLAMSILFHEWSPRDTVFASERLHQMPPKFGGGAANYSRGTSVAWYTAALTMSLRDTTALDRKTKDKIDMVLPQVWQREMLDGMPGGDTKQRAVAAMHRIWPGQSERFMRNGKYMDGLVDAALIAEWARRHYDFPPEKPQVEKAA